MTDRSDRAAFRQIARSTHPDAGGDHELFVEAMGRWSRERSQPVASNVRFHHRRTFIEAVRGAVSDALARIVDRPSIRRNT